MTDGTDRAQFVLRRATHADAAALADFAARSFQQTFGPDNEPEDMARYLAQAFSPAQQAAEIADDATTTLLAEDVARPDPVLAGYAQLIAASGAMQLKRLYLGERWKGSGLATRFIEQIVVECRNQRLPRIWLTVWTRNPRAVAFYEKIGFRICGSETFMLGTDAQTDHLMEMAVPQPLA